MCRWIDTDPIPIQLLALRDEFVSRDYDPPDTWWPDQPTVVGGRDRRAGGSWCVSDVVSGTTAVVLNRPGRAALSPEAPSRGTLPLLAVAHGPDWARFIELGPMAGFNLVLATPDRLIWWSYDGEQLRAEELARGTWMFTPTGRLDRPLDPRLAGGRAHLGADLAGSTRDAWPEWLAVIDSTPASSEPGALLVARTVGADRYETVFGQFIAARPGLLRVDHLDRPAAGGTWTTRHWPAEGR